MTKFSLGALVCILVVVAAYAGPTGRIVGGFDATEGKFPHQISLRRNNSHTCGGSIISRNYVLTAAHCVGTDNAEGNYYTYDPSVFTVRAGSSNRLSGGVVKRIVKVTVHEKYGNFLNDVALLKTDTPFIYSQNIQAIPLPSADVPVGDQVVISGWGRVKTGGDSPIQLKWNTLQAISKTRCLTSIQMFSDTLLCLAHEAENGACNGDSGGPAIYNGELVGVAGFVVGGCGSSNPDGYARVFYHVDWIKQHSDL